MLPKINGERNGNLLPEGVGDSVYNSPLSVAIFGLQRDRQDRKEAEKTLVSV